MSNLENLPADVLIQVIRYLDQPSQLELGLTSKYISYICIKQLWLTPRCTSVAKLETWIYTLNKAQNTYPYSTWLIGLDLAFDGIQHVPDSLLIPKQQISLRSLKLHNVQATSTASTKLLHLISCNRIEEIEFFNCSAEITIGFATHLLGEANKHHKLYKISFLDCYLTDALASQIVAFIPNLRSFTSQGSGYMSDTAILAITEHCPLIESLIVTLPKYIIQSNTITSISLEALSKCVHLKQLICTGQVRIASKERESWLLENCMSLKHCDLSFA
ncbi:hypothetical protein MAM1_0112c05577 [Mucor ambiguus]|uniref:F-box domain-containing protein n=1 Tax=Mucor ambiguus TaxID=91626 RepID=A0A0C9LV38_9FUNG|nr:hypothetical protein MAM1_0112c05577 [Mucor ambiguus]